MFNRVSQKKQKSDFCYAKIFSGTPHLTVFGAPKLRAQICQIWPNMPNMHIWVHIWARQIRSSGVSLKRSLRNKSQTFVFFGTPYWTLLNALKPFWKLLNTREHYWTLFNTIQHDWTLLNTIEHHWTIMNTFEHFRSLLKTIEHFWTILNTIEHNWTLLNTIGHY